MAGLILGALIGDILRREGWPQVTNRLSDRGGWTKGGVTLKAYQAEHPGATLDDLRNLTEADARAFFRRVYLERPRLNTVSDPALLALLFDISINQGPSEAVKALQRAVGVEPDGVLGPRTAGALAGSSAARVYRAVLGWRLKRYVAIALGDDTVQTFRLSHPHTQLENLAGWIARAIEFLP